jgi:hypothetical protein
VNSTAPGEVLVSAASSCLGQRRVGLCRRLLEIEPNPSTKDAELIAFKVSEYHPRRVTLPDIGPPSTEGRRRSISAV